MSLQLTSEDRFEVRGLSHAHGDTGRLQRTYAVRSQQNAPERIATYFIWGFDCNFTNYKFINKTEHVFKQRKHLARGVKFNVCFLKTNVW